MRKNKNGWAYIFQIKKNPVQVIISQWNSVNSTPIPWANYSLLADKWMCSVLHGFSDQQSMENVEWKKIFPAEEKWICWVFLIQQKNEKKISVWFRFTNEFDSMKTTWSFDVKKCFNFNDNEIIYCWNKTIKNRLFDKTINRNIKDLKEQKKERNIRGFQLAEKPNLRLILTCTISTLWRNYWFY